MANLIRLIRTGDLITHGAVTHDAEGDLIAKQKLEATRNYVFDYSDYFSTDDTVTPTLEANNLTASLTHDSVNQKVTITASDLSRYTAHFILTLTETSGEVFTIRTNINAQERERGYCLCLH